MNYILKKLKLQSPRENARGLLGSSYYICALINDSSCKIGDWASIDCTSSLRLPCVVLTIAVLLDRVPFVLNVGLWKRSGGVVDEPRSSTSI